MQSLTAFPQCAYSFIFIILENNINIKAENNLTNKMSDFRDNYSNLCAIICISEQDADGQTICAD